VTPPPEFHAEQPLSEAEFRRWYYTVAQLRAMAKSMGIATTGTKGVLTERIAAALAGRPLPAEPRQRRTRIPEPLSDDSTIPAGVILDRRVRDWFVTRLGPQFHSDHHLRTFLRENPGATLGDAAAYWQATRAAPREPIAAQFEYNRFVRRWRADHPGASHDDLVQAWHEHRAKPADERHSDGQ
jgi:hypothetical protein